MIQKIASDHLPPQDFLDTLKGSDMVDDSGVKVVYNKVILCVFMRNLLDLKLAFTCARASSKLCDNNYTNVSNSPDSSSFISFGTYPFGLLISFAYF